MEDKEPQPYRQELVNTIKKAPKVHRVSLLELAKGTKEYWHTRTDKLKKQQGEEVIDGGLGIFVKNKTLYHGSGVSGIKQFNSAEEDTVGSGIYFTSEATDAIGYANRRSERTATPILYESAIRNMKLLDLRKDDNVQKVLQNFLPLLLAKMAEPERKWYHEAALQKAIDAIEAKNVGAGNLREVTFSTGEIFTKYVKTLNYEGLVTFEGGEGDDISHHDTYVIFNPDKVTITQEQPLLASVRRG